MRIIVLGDSISISLAGLRALLNQDVEIIGCVLSLKSKNNIETNLTFNSYKCLLRQHNIPIILTEHLNDHDTVEAIKKNNPDIILNLFNTEILKTEILQNVANKGCVNVHHSLLPKCAGLNPCSWAIIDGEKYHGITTHYMEEEIDTGDIISQMKFKIDPDDTALTLFKKSTDHTGILIENTMRKLNNNENAIEQDLSQRSYHDKEIPFGGKINFGWPAQKIYDFIRAFDFWPYVSSIGRPFMFYGGNIINVLKAGVSKIHHSEEKPVGTILEFFEDSVLVNTASNTILVKSVWEGKQMVSAVDYFKKIDMRVGDILL